jgi:hypothetical protein
MMFENINGKKIIYPVSGYSIEDQTKPCNVCAMCESNGQSLDHDPVCYRLKYTGTTCIIITNLHNVYNI